MATIISAIARTKTIISGKPVIKPPVSDAFSLQQERRTFFYSFMIGLKFPLRNVQKTQKKRFFCINDTNFSVKSPHSVLCKVPPYIQIQAFHEEAVAAFFQRIQAQGVLDFFEPVNQGVFVNAQKF